MEFLIIIFLILLNGAFSMSEIALISSRKFTLENLAKRGNKKAGKALNLSENPNHFLSTVQIGITLIGILLGIFSGDKITGKLEAFLNKIPVLGEYSETLAVLLVVMIITYFSIVFGELLPKRIGLTFPEKIASHVAGPMNVLSGLMKPFVWLLSHTNELFLRIFGIKEKQEGIITEDEIKSIIATSTSGGEIQEIEQIIVKRVFALGDRKAGELMTHRSELVWIDINDSLTEVRETIRRSSHPVYPVSDGSPDKLLGLVSVREIFQNSFQTAEFSLHELVKKPVYVPENMPAYRVLEKFKEFRIHLVVVVDEYGAVQGVLSVKDIVDSLIGDTHVTNPEDFNIVKRDENSWLADGLCPYYKLVEYFQLTNIEEAEGFTTLAGLILSKLNNIPVTGERIQWEGFELEIVDMDAMRIDKVMITTLK
ncbi:MAG TPA: hemolysin family protein [Daejeonella sp.]|nr:hemolysin family protein [Daejeonella sp.]